MLVKELGKGGFFGEVALVTKAETRVADCIAKTRSTLNIHPASSTADISHAKEGALRSVIAEVLNTVLLAVCDRWRVGISVNNLCVSPVSPTRSGLCIANGEGRCKCRCRLLALGRDAFERLMGPAEDILLKEVQEYETLNRTIRQASGASTQAEQIK